jgi:GH18 family chitinase
MLNTKTDSFYFYPYNSTANTFNTINIVGYHSDWAVTDPTYNMTKLNPEKENHNWIFRNFTLANDSEVKFAADNDWANNWGATAFPFGQGELNGPNIPVAAGTYDVYFNDITGDYNFIKK